MESPSDKLAHGVKSMFAAKFYLPEIKEWAAMNILWIVLACLAFINFFSFGLSDSSHSNCNSGFSGHLKDIDC